MACDEQTVCSCHQPSSVLFSIWQQISMLLLLLSHCRYCICSSCILRDRKRGRRCQLSANPSIHLSPSPLCHLPLLSLFPPRLYPHPFPPPPLSLFVCDFFSSPPTAKHCWEECVSKWREPRGSSCYQRGHSDETAAADTQLGAGGVLGSGVPGLLDDWHTQAGSKEAKVAQTLGRQSA